MLILLLQDLFFLHERGRMMGWCVILLSSGNSLGPLCAGFMVSGGLPILSRVSKGRSLMY